MSESPVIKVDNLSIGYGGETILSNISFDLIPGEILSVMGVSGAGKSSILRAIAGFVPPHEGTIHVAGRDVSIGSQVHVPTEDRGLGMMFQDYALFPHMTVADNIGYGIHTEPDRSSRIHELLDLVGLPDFGDRYPPQLSGGQQQRVALARALAPKPRALLLDEPFANLDGSLRQDMGDEVRRILKEQGAAAILVSHDRTEAISLADRLAVLHRVSPAETYTLGQTGSPEAIYKRPASGEIALLTGAAHFITGAANGTTAETAIGPVQLSQPTSGCVTVIIRPEQVRFEADPAGNCLLFDLRYITPGYRARIKTPAGTITALIDEKTSQPQQQGRIEIVGTCHGVP